MMIHPSLSKEHIDNSERIEALESSGRIGKELVTLFIVTNNLEEIARSIVENYNFRQTEELDFAHKAAQEYIAKMTERFGFQHSRLVERAKQSYNAILRRANVTEDYTLGDRN